MNPKEYHARKKHKKLVEKTYKAHALSKYQRIVTKILMKEMGECNGLEIEAILEPGTNEDLITMIVFRCKIRFVQRYYRMFYKLDCKRYKLEELPKDIYQIFQGTFTLNQDLLFRKEG